MEQAEIGLVYIAVVVEIGVRTIQERRSQVRARPAGIEQAGIGVIHDAVAVQISRQGRPFQALVRPQIY